MTYVICEPCVGVCDTACVEVCPVDCIHPPEGWDKGDDATGVQLYIDPEECIDCSACEPECPVEAIFADDDVPEQWKNYVEINAKFFENK